HPEAGTPDPTPPERLRRNGFEVATRLTYFLRGSRTQSALLDLAAKGGLNTAQRLEMTARGLVADPRLKGAMRSFAEQWFRITKIGSTFRDSKLFPLYSGPLLTSMLKEQYQLFDDFMLTPGASFLDLHTTRSGYVDDHLARIYG